MSEARVYKAAIGLAFLRALWRSLAGPPVEVIYVTGTIRMWGPVVRDLG